MSSGRKPVAGTFVPSRWLNGLQDESAAARLPTRLDAPPRESRATRCEEGDRSNNCFFSLHFFRDKKGHSSEASHSRSRAGQ